MSAPPNTMQRTPGHCLLASGPLPTYGNTDALMLDSLKERAGFTRSTIKRYSDSHSTTYADAMKGRAGPRALQSKQHETRARTQLLEQNDYLAKRPATCDDYMKALAPYLPFPKLLEERRMACNYPSFRSTSANPKGFCDLPAELRNSSYNEYLVLDESIELLPRSWYLKHQIDHYKRKHADVLKLLRLNRQIHKEASDIYYGVNKFRFTGTLGWVWLRGFMQTIGSINTSLLRHITIHVHWEGVATHNDEWFVQESDFNRGKEDWPETHHLIPVKTFCHKTHALKGCFEAINKAGVLETLELVLPFRFRVQNVWNLPLDTTKFKKPVQVKLLHLCDYFLSGDVPDTSQTPLVKVGQRLSRRRNVVFEKSEFVDPKAFAESRGWEYEIVYSDSGHKMQYPIAPHPQHTLWKPVSN